jgi:hypothetical protein
MPNLKNEKRYLGVSGAARALRISESAVRDVERRGVLPAERIATGQRNFQSGRRRPREPRAIGWADEAGIVDETMTSSELHHVIKPVAAGEGSMRR